MKLFFAGIFISLFALFISSCRDQPNNNINNNINNNNEIVPAEDTVYALLSLQVEQGGDTVYTVGLNRLPYSFPRFSQVQAYTSATPDGGAAIFLMALKIYQQYNKEGIKALVSAVSEQVKINSTSAESYKGFALYTGDMSIIKSTLGANPALTTAYLRGSEPKNSYTPQGPPYYYDFKYDKNNTDWVNGTVKVFILTQGADSPRPITMVRDSDGIWRAKSFSSVLAGLK